MRKMIENFYIQTWRESSLLLKGTYAYTYTAINKYSSVNIEENDGKL